MLYIFYQLLNEKCLKKLLVNKLTFSYNSLFNYRWLCYVTDHSGAVAPSSVQLVWSLLHPAFIGTLVINMVNVIRHYIYSTCQGCIMWVWDLQIIGNCTIVNWLVNALC